MIKLLTGDKYHPPVVVSEYTESPKDDAIEKVLGEIEGGAERSPITGRYRVNDGFKESISEYLDQKGGLPEVALSELLDAIQSQSDETPSRMAIESSIRKKLEVSKSLSIKASLEVSNSPVSNLVSYLKKTKKYENLSEPFIENMLSPYLSRLYDILNIDKLGETEKETILNEICYQAQHRITQSIGIGEESRKTPSLRYIFTGVDDPSISATEAMKTIVKNSMNHRTIPLMTSEQVDTLLAIDQNKPKEGYKEKVYSWINRVLSLKEYSKEDLYKNLLSNDQQFRNRFESSTKVDSYIGPVPALSKDIVDELQSALDNTPSNLQLGLKRLFTKNESLVANKIESWANSGNLFKIAGSKAVSKVIEHIGGGTLMKAISNFAFKGVCALTLATGANAILDSQHFGIADSPEIENLDNEIGRTENDWFSRLDIFSSQPVESKSVGAEVSTHSFTIREPIPTPSQTYQEIENLLNQGCLVVDEHTLNDGSVALTIDYPENPTELCAETLKFEDIMPRVTDPGAPGIDKRITYQPIPNSEVGKDLGQYLLIQQNSATCHMHAIMGIAVPLLQNKQGMTNVLINPYLLSEIDPKFTDKDIINIGNFLKNIPDFQSVYGKELEKVVYGPGALNYNYFKLGGEGYDMLEELGIKVENIHFDGPHKLPNTNSTGPIAVSFQSKYFTSSEGSDNFTGGGPFLNPILEEFKDVSIKNFSNNGPWGGQEKSTVEFTNQSDYETFLRRYYNKLFSQYDTNDSQLILSTNTRDLAHAVVVTNVGELGVTIIESHVTDHSFLLELQQDFGKGTVINKDGTLFIPYKNLPGMIRSMQVLTFNDSTFNLASLTAPSQQIDIIDEESEGRRFASMSPVLPPTTEAEEVQEPIFLSPTPIPDTWREYVQPTILPDGKLVFKGKGTTERIHPDNLPKIEGKTPEDIFTVVYHFNPTDSENLRYQADRKYTYCNIFARDVSQGMQREIPVLRIEGDEIRKLSANYIYDWLKKEGESLGWLETLDPNNAQEAANKGNLVYAVVKNPSGGSGHIAIVLPTNTADPNTGQVLTGQIVDGIYHPPVAQAGSVNVIGVGPDGNQFTTYEAFRSLTLKYESEITYFIAGDTPYQFSHNTSNNNQ